MVAASLPLRPLAIQPTAREELASAFTPGTHGSTFGGNPLAAAVGNAVMDTVTDEAFLNNIKELGNYFKAELRKLVRNHSALLKEVTGVGLMLGLVCSVDAVELNKRLQQQKLLVVKASGNSIRLLPALNISRDEIDSALQIINKVLLGWDK